MRFFIKVASAKLTLISVVIVLLSGCSSNGPIIEEQKRQKQQNQRQVVQINILERKVDVLSNEIQYNSARNAKADELLDKLVMNKQELNRRAIADIKRYRIQEKDTLYRIAKDSNISLDKLLKLNPQINVATILLIGSFINIR